MSPRHCPIEHNLPLADISIRCLVFAASAREKNIRHGHPSTLHIWWARRPLASYRARAGTIRLSHNEWEKARHFGETVVQERKRSGSFWLYVVTEAGTDEPDLHRIHDPAARFRMDEDIVATGYIIHEETWRERTRSD